MAKKLYVCRNCGYTFPDELSKLIENKIQVFCEFCGTAFNIEGIKFIETKSEKATKGKKKVDSAKSQTLTSSLFQIIKKFTKVTWIPILIVSIILLFIPSTLFLGLAGILISLYDLKYISKEIKKNKFEHIVLDSFCMGVLGCIIFGTGVLILIKGILLFIYEANNSKNQPLYYFGLKLKNSLNNFSAFAGIIIIILSFQVILRRMDISLIILTIFISLAIIVILIDLIFRNKIYKKQKFDVADTLGVISLGIIGTMFSAAGIFILLKGVIIFCLLFGKPPEVKQASIVKKEPIYYSPKSIESRQISHKEELKEKIVEREEIGPQKLEQIPKEKLDLKEKPEEKRIKIEEEREEEDKLELHDSLLPLKDEKDKKLVKEYFAKIFTLMSKDLRNQIKRLDIPKEERKQLLNELVFLSEEQQKKYLEAIVDVYKEIPIKIIERIRKLPNIKSEHLFKIAEQLKFMDLEEQEEYIQFLEKNA